MKKYMFDFLQDQARISFLLGGVSYKELSPKIETDKNEKSIKTVYTFKDGLRLTNILHYYPEFNACDWVNEWENTSDAPTEIISELWDCSVELPLPPCAEKLSSRAYLPKSENVIKVYSPSGSEWSGNEFYCDVDRIKLNHRPNWLEKVGSKHQYATSGGRSADSNIAPFFNIRHDYASLGYIAAIGWTGQWNAEIERKEASVIFKSKIEDTNFRILPGERFRTSSVTLMAYSGSVQNGQNAWRRLVKEVYSPIGKSNVPRDLPFCAGLWGGMSTKGCLDRIRKVEAAKLPFNCYWMDAGWYGAGDAVSPDEYEGDWERHTGNWEINHSRHPDLLKDVVSEISKSDKRFLLWFEPERVRKSAPIALKHPEYLIFSEDENNSNTLLNLGNEAAWSYCFETLSDLIERLNVSIYRQDFNFQPLPYWRKNDTPERRGITEIKHINGMYRLWDALLERFPYLLIDNCASGGRRIDIETLRRSVPLWRSDAQCPADPIPEIAQSHAMCHSAWMPYSGTGVGRVWFDTYRFRSAYAPALTTNFTFSERNVFGDDPEAMKWLDKMCNEYVRVRRYLSEDVYPLTAPSTSDDVWAAIQYHDPKTDSGIIQIFRRANSPYEEASLRLYGLDPEKKYAFEDADGGLFEEFGKDLITLGLRLKITERRTAKLYFYK